MGVRHWLLAGWAGSIGLAVTTATLAAGYALREQSAVGQGASFAGIVARGSDPSMMYFNPAALGWLDGVQASLVGSAISPTVAVDSAGGRRAAALGGSPIGGRTGGDAASDAVVPATYLTLPLGDLRLGLAITSPFGLVTKYPGDFVGRYHALTSELRTVNIAPSVAWRPSETLSLGAGLQVQYADARISNAVDFGAVLAGRGARVAPGSADGRLTLGGDDVGIGWQAGAQWRPLPGTQLGLAFRSAIHHRLEGEARFEGVPSPLAAGFRDGAAQVKLTTPEAVGVGLAQAIGDRFTLLAGAEWTNWSRFRSLVVAFDNGLPKNVTEHQWRDSVFLSLGGEYRLSESVTLRSGLAWDQSPVPDRTRTPRIPDSHRTWLSAGFTWEVTPSLALSGGYTHIFGGSADVGLAAGGATSTNFLRGDLAARYSASVDIVTAQVSLRF